MGATYDDTVVQDHELQTHKEHWTTIVLEKQHDETWLATQGGVAVEGHGETAADAAAEYCQKIAETGDE